MKYFKHDTSAHFDAKMQEIILDYGMEGYGLYWFCLELISSEVTTHKLTFELEHDARIIARMTGVTVHKVEEIMKKFIELGLFENNGGRVTCLQLLKRIDTSMTSNPAFRKAIMKAKNDMESHDSVMMESGHSHDPVMTKSCIEDRRYKIEDKKHIREKSATVSPVPVQEIVNLYHEVLPQLPRVQKITGKRQSQIKARWKSGDIADMNEWRDYFEHVKKSKFLMGYADGNPDRKTFKADLEWLTRESNFVKVWEGRYHGEK